MMRRDIMRYDMHACAKHLAPLTTMGLKYDYMIECNERKKNDDR